MEDLQKFKHLHQENTALPARVEERASHHAGGTQGVRFPEGLRGLRREEIAGGAKFPSRRGPAPNKGGKTGGVHHEQKIEGQGKIQEIRGDFRQGARERLPAQAAAQGKRHLPASIVISLPYAFIHWPTITLVKHAYPSEPPPFNRALYR